MIYAPYIAKEYESYYHNFDAPVKYLVDNCLDLADSFMAMHYYAMVYLNIPVTAYTGDTFEPCYYTEIPDEHDLKRTFVMAILFALEGCEPNYKDACIDFSKIHL